MRLGLLPVHRVFLLLTIFGGPNFALERHVSPTPGSAGALHLIPIFCRAGLAVDLGLEDADGLKTMTRRGRIGASTLVLGLRPIRSPFDRTTNEPNPDSLTISPRTAASEISSRTD
jgi:hypothetical protein